MRRRLTRPEVNGLDVVDWGARSVQITEPGGRTVFAAADVEAPAAWSELAIAVVARRYFVREPGAVPERSIRALVDRVASAIASWADDAGHVRGDGERDALRDELAALVLMQRATFATPVWLNAGLSERPLTLLDRSFPA